TDRSLRDGNHRDDHAASDVGGQDAVRDLVRRVQGGDVDAFEPLYRMHAGRVYALCLRMSGDTVRARELVQDVFVRAWERIGTFRGESLFSSWLHRLAVNLVLQEDRGARRRWARVETRDDATLSAHAMRDGSPEQRLDLETAIAALPPGARRVFVLHDIEGYTHEEISRLTGSAAGTLRAQLFRAHRLLKEALAR
ncbi:MAG: RNA polymerase sigma factor, partial [Gemmatimonadaceae bacterium]